jgi:hypothetical protein
MRSQVVACALPEKLNSAAEIKPPTPKTEALGTNASGNKALISLISIVDIYSL